MSRALLIVVGLFGTGCFEAWSPSGQFACAKDGTCPGSFVCDSPAEGPAVCCDPARGRRCPTLLAADGTCARGDAPTLFFRDRDGDGFGNPNEPVRRCARPLGYALPDAGADCDDTLDGVNPRTPEQCNGLDDNCDGVIDEGLTPRRFFGRDDDADGYPQHDAGVEACRAPTRTIDVATAPHDCQGLDPAKHPDAGELCNNFDDDCDGSIVAGQYLDTQLASEPPRLPCSTGARGVCASGVITCDRGIRPLCTPIVAPSWERCDGIDTDCDGVDDNPPGCGGPLRLAGQAGFTYGGGIVPSNAPFTTSCLKSSVTRPGTNALGRLTGVRPNVNTESFLLWWVEAPVGQEWDLSARDLHLRLKWSSTGTAPDPTLGFWGLPGSTYGVQPVVYLCTDDPSQLVRYRWRDAATAFGRTAAGFDATAFLDGRDTGEFLLGQGSGADTRKVRRIEVMVRFFGGTYDFAMQPEAGLSQ